MKGFLKGLFKICAKILLILVVSIVCAIRKVAQLLEKELDKGINKLK